MDRDTILKHSKSVRLHNTLLPDIGEILEDFCKRREHPEYLQGLTQILGIPMIGQQVLNLILEEYEKEFHIIKLLKLQTNQLIDIW